MEDGSDFLIFMAICGVVGLIMDFACYGPHQFGLDLCSFVVIMSLLGAWISISK